ncbi:MAG: cation transporting ATPase C-terminal domain-containing protein [Stenomitos frigidus ULC029]
MVIDALGSQLQILWMNLVTDGLPAQALAVKPGRPIVMQQPPKEPKENIFARGLGSYIIRIGIILLVITILMMVWAYGYTAQVQSELLLKFRLKSSENSSTPYRD